MELKNNSSLIKMGYFYGLKRKMKRYHKHNFFKHTYCVFKGADFEAIQGKTANYKSKSGSHYFYTSVGVYRLSNHWGRAANCRWRLENGKEDRVEGAKLGFAEWTSFYSDTSGGELYFISVNFETNKAQYHHKLSRENCQNSLVKTAGYTLKRMREIKDILEQDGWLKYMDSEDVLTLRREIVLQLMQTNKTLREIKLSYR